MTKVTVRQYEPRDEQQLRAVARQNFIDQLQEGSVAGAEDPAERAYLEHVIRIQEGGKGVILVAEQGGELIGFVCLSGPVGNQAEGERQDAYAFMSDLFVVPEYRNRGTGSRLVREIEQHAHAMGAGHVALRIAVGNDVSRRFYEKNRYREKFVVLSKGISEV
ncbi:MAG: GNAT family N-acetyltransferase [Thiogranum sp.]